jgi:hypothetical protein
VTNLICTDPYLSDTDEDGLTDSIDPYPITPPCMDPTYLSLAAWWDGSATGLAAQDIMVAEPLANIRSNGAINGDGAGPEDDVIIAQNWRLIRLGIHNPQERVFRFNVLSQTRSNQTISVEDNSATHTSLHSNRELSVSAWVFWNGAAPDAPHATILSKGLPNSATYDLSILKDGKLRFSIFRNVHEKIWYCWFGTTSTCDDNSAKDDDYNQQASLTTTSTIQERGTHVTPLSGRHANLCVGRSRKKHHRPGGVTLQKHIHELPGFEQ